MPDRFSPEEVTASARAIYEAVMTTDPFGAQSASSFQAAWLKVSALALEASGAVPAAEHERVAEKFANVGKTCKVLYKRARRAEAELKRLHRIRDEFGEPADLRAEVARLREIVALTKDRAEKAEDLIYATAGGDAVLVNVADLNTVRVRAEKAEADRDTLRGALEEVQRERSHGATANSEHIERVIDAALSAAPPSIAPGSTR